MVFDENGLELKDEESIKLLQESSNIINDILALDEKVDFTNFYNLRILTMSLPGEIFDPRKFGTTEVAEQLKSTQLSQETKELIKSLGWYN